MLESLSAGFARERQRIMARHRVMLCPAGPRAAPVEEPDAIASIVPRIHLDAPSGKACEHKRILRFEEGESWAAYRLPYRDPNGEPEWRPEFALHARPLRGGPVPVWQVHPESCTIRLFVALTGASFIEGAVGVKPAAFLARILLERPIEAILRQDGEAHVGHEVAARLRSFLALCKAGENGAWTAELRLLERMEPDAVPLHPYLVRRLAALRRSFGDKGRTIECPPVTDAEVQREISRLRKLVEARTLSSLKLGEREIRGVLNPSPGPLGDSWPAVGFRLWLGPRPIGPRLNVWSAPAMAESNARPGCWGEKGVEILDSFRSSDDIYGIADTVINYIETNRVDVVQVERCVVPRRLIRRWLGGRHRRDPALPSTV